MFVQADIKRLPEIKKILTERLLPEYNRIKGNLVLYKIEEFGNNVRQAADELNFKWLINYAEKLQNEAESISIDELEITLHRFPQIIEYISTTINDTNEHKVQ